jgi:hypothetical protein
MRSPRLSWSDTSSKSARPAKDFESWETVSIAESAQCPLVRRPAQLLSRQQISLYAKVGVNRFATRARCGDRGGNENVRVHRKSARFAVSIISRKRPGWANLCLKGLQANSISNKNLFDLLFVLR